MNLTPTRRVWTVVRDPAKRRAGYAITALVLALLCVFPQPYVSRAKILPQDTSSAGVSAILNSLGGQLQNFASLLAGGRPPNDLYLIIGRSDTVARKVIDALKWVGPDARYSTLRDAKLALARKVDVHLLLGGVVEIETTTHDPSEAQQIGQAYVSAISRQIGAFGRENIVRKRQIVNERFNSATMRVARAEAALNAFRQRNRLADPEAQLGSALFLRSSLQAELQAKQVGLQVLQRFEGAANPQLQGAETEIASLRAQIARTAQPSLSAAGPNVAGLSEITTQYLNLFRDYRFSQALYEVYARSAEQVAVEELVADSASYVQVIEAPHIDAERHFNLWAEAALALVALVALFTEIYVPATGFDARRGDPDPA